MKSLKVRNLPEMISEDILNKLFSRFGEIKGIVIEKTENGKSPKFARIKLASPLTYEKIIKVGAKIGPVQLLVEPLYQPTDAELARRKICLFGVPKSFKSRKLKKIFQNQFGKVENAYIRKTRSRLYNYGFVTFSDYSTAQRALKQKVVIVSDTKEKINIELEVRKFFIKSEKNMMEYFENKNFEFETEIKQTMRENNRNFFDNRGEVSLSQRKNDYLSKGKKIRTDSEDQKVTTTQNTQQYFFNKSLSHPQKGGNQKLINEEEELAYLSQFGYMSPWKLKLYLKKVSFTLKKKLTFTDIQQLELFHFNRKNQVKRLGNRALRSKKLRKKINDNHYFHNILLNPVKKFSEGKIRPLVARRDNNRRGLVTGEESLFYHLNFEGLEPMSERNSKY